VYDPKRLLAGESITTSRCDLGPYVNDGSVGEIDEPATGADIALTHRVVWRGRRSRSVSTIAMDSGVSVRNMHGGDDMNMREPQSSIAWVRDATYGTALVGDVPISKRVAPIADKARTIRRLAGEVLKDGTGLLRDLVHERPMLVFGVVTMTALLLGRFASARTLATAATIGVEAAKLGNVGTAG
jgi:hypothetical protein